MVMLDRCRLCFCHKKKEEKESFFDHYELRMLFERDFGISYRDFLKEKHLAVICVECRVKLQNATPEEMEIYRSDARFRHYEVFYTETRVHFGLSKNWDDNDNPFVRRSQRERKAVQDKTGDEFCVVPPKRMKPQVKIQVQSNKSFKCTKCNKEFPSKSKRDSHMKEHRTEQRSFKNPRRIRKFIEQVSAASRDHKDVLKLKPELELPQELPESVNVEVRNSKRQKTSLQSLYPDMEFYGMKRRADKSNVSVQFNEKSFPRIRQIRIVLQDIGLIWKPIKEKQFACQFCPKVFMRKNYLDLHMELKHSDVANFICKHCEQGFPSRSLRKLHHKQVHPLAKVHKQSIPECEETKVNPKRHTRPLQMRFPDMDFKFSGAKKILKNRGSTSLVEPDRFQNKIKQADKVLDDIDFANLDPTLLMLSDHDYSKMKSDGNSTDTEELDMIGINQIKTKDETQEYNDSSKFDSHEAQSLKRIDAVLSDHNYGPQMLLELDQNNSNGTGIDTLFSEMSNNSIVKTLEELIQDQSTSGYGRIEVLEQSQNEKTYSDFVNGDMADKTDEIADNAHINDKEQGIAKYNVTQQGNDLNRLQQLCDFSVVLQRNKVVVRETFKHCNPSQINSSNDKEEVNAAMEAPHELLQDHLFNGNGNLSKEGLERTSIQSISEVEITNNAQIEDGVVDSLKENGEDKVDLKCSINRGQGQKLFSKSVDLPTPNSSNGEVNIHVLKKNVSKDLQKTSSDILSCQEGTPWNSDLIAEGAQECDLQMSHQKLLVGDDDEDIANNHGKGQTNPVKA